MTDRSRPPPFRVALVGAGLISDLHIKCLREMRDVVVCAIVDSDLERARAKAARYGIARVYGEQGEMLGAEQPDVVHVLTPPSTHASLCVDALRRDAHVYVEKPMALTEADCDSMIEAVQESGCQLCVGHSLVYDPLLAQALEVIDRGEIGELIHASAVYCFDPERIPGYGSKGWYRRLGGGFVEDLAAHPASLLLRLLGTPHQVTGAVDSRPRRGRSGVAALIEAERGTGSLLVSLDSRPEDVSLEVRGTRGLVTVNFSTMVVSLQRDRNLPSKLRHGARNLAAARDLALQTFTNAARLVAKRMDTTKGVHTLLRAFYDALTAGAPVPVGATEGRDVVRLLRALWPETPLADPSARWVLSSPRTALRAAATRPASRMRNALVTGATGFIGTHLVQALASRGVNVRALARDPQRGRALEHPNVEVVIGDFIEPAVVEGMAEGIDTIFHLASVMRGGAEEFEKVDLAGGRRLIEEAKRARVGRIVFTSTMGAYALAGLADGDSVTEDMIDRPERVGSYARAKLLIEEQLFEGHRVGHFEAVIARPGLVFGPGSSPFLEHLPHLGTLRRDRYVVFGDSEVPLQLTYVENCVDALCLCATVADAAGLAFTVVDDDVPTQREFVKQLGALTGRPLRVTAVPRAGAYLVGLGVEALAAATRRTSPTTRRLLMGKTLKLSFDTSRAKQILGWRPAVAWEEGLRRNVAWTNAGRG